MNINAGAIKRLKSEIQEIESCIGQGFTLNEWLKCRVDLLEYLEADTRRLNLKPGNLMDLQ